MSITRRSHRPLRRALLVTTAVVASSVAALTSAAHAEACPVLDAQGVPSVAPHPGVVWTGCNLTLMVTAGGAYNGGDLANTNLTSADLTSANFAGTNLYNVNLTSATVDYANLSGANVSKVNLTSVSARNTNLAGANLGLAELGAGNFLHANFATANLADATATAADFTSANFNGANLASATFQDAHFNSASLVGTNVDDADFSGADFSGATLTNVAGNAYWAYATCPDGAFGYQHVHRSCLEPLDTIKPTVTMTAPGTFSGTLDTSAPTATAAWIANDNSGVFQSDVRYYTQPALGGTRSAWVTATALDSYTVTPALKGTRYCFQTQVSDFAENSSGWSAARCTTTPFDDSSFIADTKWAKAAATGWLSNTKTSSSTRLATLSSNGSKSVRQVGLLARTCTTCGTVDVYVGALRIGQLSLKSASTNDHAIVSLPKLAVSRTGVVKFVVTSTAKQVVIDGIFMTNG